MLVARRAIEKADVAVLVVDATEGATDQDAAIAGEADKAGCGVIIAANKWDLMKGKGPDFSKTFDEELRRQLKFLDYAPSCTSRPRRESVPSRSWKRSTRWRRPVRAGFRPAS